MTLMVDRVLAAAFRENKIASLDLLKNVVKTKDGFKNLGKEEQKEVSDILGMAHLAMLRLEDAACYFQDSGNAAMLQSVFELGLRHGKYALIKWLRDCGLKINETEYRTFLKEKVLPFVPMYRDDKLGFQIDEKVLDAVIKELGEPREKVLTETVEFMEKEGSLNIVKKYILAHYAKNDALIRRYEDEFNKKGSGGREYLSGFLEEYCRGEGLEPVKTLQQGDTDNYFPSVASIFLVRQNDRKLVLKENLRLQQDYSRINGYSMEKEILEAINHDNIVKYLGSTRTDGTEFLVLEFMPGVTLEKYVKPHNLLPLDKTVEIIKTMAGVIDYLHGQNIISMDIKDKNVMYDGQKATFFDFGVSQITRNSQITSLLTTPEYTAPEMATTFRAYPQTDIFQLGILFYKLLCGKNPFVRYDLYDFDEDENHRESCIIKFVLPMIFRPIDKTPKVLQANPVITALLESMLQKDYRKRPEPQEIIRKLGG